MSIFPRSGDLQWHDRSRMCNYRGVTCFKLRAVKTNNERHQFCTTHRENHNATQRRARAKKRLRDSARLLHSVAESTDDEVQFVEIEADQEDIDACIDHIEPIPFHCVTSGERSSIMTGFPSFDDLEIAGDLCTVVPVEPDDTRLSETLLDALSMFLDAEDTSEQEVEDTSDQEE